MAASGLSPSGVSEDHQYVVPVKEVKSQADLEKWEKSEAYQEYVGFILRMNEAVRSKVVSHPSTQSSGIAAVLGILEQLSQWVEEIPPIDQPQRFGNKAFRTWYQKLKDNSTRLLQEALPEKMHHSIPEIEVYLVESMGNSTRIDYGTGHEMNFIMFLLCLFKIGLLQDNDDDNVAAVNKVFQRYLTLVRTLQLTYRMEPAGSHGVWSLDDYQFVPFIWGSSQLINHPKIEPKSFYQESTVKEYASDFMFLGCIKYILEVKSGPFHEHSNQLWNISGLPTWSKINSGLCKMYKAEVLGKLPVIQHTYFGSLLPFRPGLRQSACQGGRMPPPPFPLNANAASTH